jgi:hypothetical protein
MNDLINRNFAIAVIMEQPGNMDKEKAKELLLRIPSENQLTKTDFAELRDRFGEYVEFVVQDMISGKGERWTKINA